MAAWTQHQRRGRRHDCSNEAAPDLTLSRPSGLAQSDASPNSLGASRRSGEACGTCSTTTASPSRDRQRRSKSGASWCPSHRRGIRPSIVRQPGRRSVPQGDGQSRGRDCNPPVRVPVPAFRGRDVERASLDAAIKATVERRLPIFTAAETARLHAAAEALPDERRLAETLARRPPILVRMPEVHVNTEGAQRALADIALRVHGGQPPATFADALSSFDDYFPGLEGEERRTERYRAQSRADLVREPARVQSTASRRNFSRSRSYVQLRGFSRIGGVLLGRMPESGGSLDIRDLNWTLAGKELWLELRSADGGMHRLGPYPAAIAHLALAYAADGRPTTVTMVRADPLPELKILLHPALVDTPLGCRATRLDQFADEFSNEIEELGRLRAEATRHAEAELALYEYAWAARFFTFPRQTQALRRSCRRASSTHSRRAPRKS